MSLVWLESAQRVRTAATYDRSYMTRGQWKSTQGRAGGPSLYGGYVVYPKHPVPSGDYFYGHLLFRQTTLANAMLIGPCKDPNSATPTYDKPECYVRTTSTGQLLFGTGSIGSFTTLGSSSDGIIATATLYDLVVEIFLDPTTGYGKVWLDGVLVINATGVDTMRYGTTGGGWNAVAFSDSQIGDSYHVCDIVALDSANPTGNDPCTAAVLINARVDALFPDGAGYSSSFTPSTGSNYQCVDENNPNSDTDYVSAATAATRDGYALGAITAGAVVRGVRVVAEARKEDNAVATGKVGVRISGTNYLSSEQELGSAYNDLTNHFGVNPATSGAWSESVVNALEAVVEKTS